MKKKMKWIQGPDEIRAALARAVEGDFSPEALEDLVRAFLAGGEGRWLLLTAMMAVPRAEQARVVAALAAAWPELEEPQRQAVLRALALLPWSEAAEAIRRLAESRSPGAPDAGAPDAEAAF